MTKKYPSIFSNKEISLQEGPQSFNHFFSEYWASNMCQAWRCDGKSDRKPALEMFTIYYRREKNAII
jgi:hypothetical protein